ncbi:hypothetical protein P3W45_001617 [Vairimorpha bombi]|jgi:hypothetical protein
MSTDNKSGLPADTRSEIKQISYIDVNNKKYRLVYTKSTGANLTRDILKIEINYNLEEIIYNIRDILETKKYKRIHVFTKYKYFVQLSDKINEIYSVLNISKYRTNFAYVSKKYKEEDYLLVYDIIWED